MFNRMNYSQLFLILNNFQIIIWKKRKSYQIQQIICKFKQLNFQINYYIITKNKKKIQEIYTQNHPLLLCNIAKYKKSISELLAVVQYLSQEKEIQEFDYEQRIETLIDFNNKRDLLYQLQQKETEVVLFKNQAINEWQTKMNEQYYKLQEEYKIIDDQRKELLGLSQQMKNKITENNTKLIQ